jgi:hypothetical protein
MLIAWLKHEPELEIPQVVKGEGLHDCMTGGCFSFHNFDFAPAEYFVEAKITPADRCPGGTGVRLPAPSGAKSM